MKFNSPLAARSNNLMSGQFWAALAFLSLAVFSPASIAQFTDAKDTVCGFFSNINSLLSMASIAVVTIAVIFAGYQIAFAHKRISDVAPILIGGLLIGAAGQIATMLLPNNEQCDSGGATAMNIIHSLTQLV
jgi:type IV secretion system protein VirB2